MSEQVALLGMVDSSLATDDLLAKVHDKELVKPLGFINGEWVGATDGSTIDVRLVLPHGCTVNALR